MILPVTDDRDSGPFFEAAAQQRLVYLACPACDRGIHPPTPFCQWCGAEGEWRDASGQGRVHCSTIVMHQVHPDYPVPYTVVVVELVENPDVRLLGRLEGAVEVAHGTQMTVHFEEFGEGVTLPNWRIADR